MQITSCSSCSTVSKDFCNSTNFIGIRCWRRRVYKNIFKSTIILLFRWSHFSKCGRSQILPQPSQELVRLSRCGRRSGNYDYQCQYFLISILIFLTLLRPCQELLRLSRCGRKSRDYDNGCVLKEIM